MRRRHQEAGEKIEKTAARELVEETGATSFSISAITDYSVTFRGEETFGRLFFAEVDSMGPLPDSEIGEIALVEHLPADLTYPDIQPLLSEQAHAYIRTARVPGPQSPEKGPIRSFGLSLERWQ